MTHQKSHVSSHQGLCVANGMGWMWGRGWWWVGGDVTGRDSCVCYDHCIDSLYNLTGRYMCTVCPICDGWYVHHAREGNSASEIVVASENECERRKSGDESRPMSTAVSNDIDRE